MASVPLRIADGVPDKYGLMIVKNRSGGLARVHRITGKELASLKKAGSYTPQTHLHVTQQEWESGRVTCAGMGLDVGEVMELEGRAVICYGSLGEMLVLDRAEYTGNVPRISAEKIVLDRAKVGRFASLSDGVLEVV